jgi:hypothetical protein
MHLSLVRGNAGSLLVYPLCHYVLYADKYALSTHLDFVLRSQCATYPCLECESICE